MVAWLWRRAKGASAKGFASRLRRVVAGRRGATAIEYALIAAGLSIAITTAVFLVGADVKTLFEDVANVVNTR